MEGEINKIWAVNAKQKNHNESSIHVGVEIVGNQITAKLSELF